VTVDPTALQTARLALATIATTWPTLAGAADTTLTRRTAVTVPLTAERAALRDAGLRAEREDRDRTERYRALASTRPPCDLDVVDVRTNVLQVVHTSVLLARSDLAPWLGRRGTTLGMPPRRVTVSSIHSATRWLADALDHTGGSTAASIGAELRPAARRVHQVLGIDPDTGWTAMGTSRCPACRQRALYRWADSPDRRAWTRECRNPDCVCTGAGCPCGRDGARAGSRHLWQA
jgi:hypothetical protein